MKKILFGILLVGVIAGVIYLCSDGEDDHYDDKEVITCPRDDAIRWNILYDVNVGNGLLKLEYPDCFELDDSICGDSDVTMSYKGEADLFLTASVIENKMHLNTKELADSMVNQINEEGTSVTSSGNVTAVPVPSVTLKNLGALRSGPRQQNKNRIRLRQE